MQPIAAPLLQWFQANKRLLPFRQEPSAYHIWVSEIMLQQTRVAAAIPYYNRFIAALPTPAVMAPATRRLFTRRVLDQMPKAAPGPYNEALMELGALVCIPGTPHCEACPLADRCLGCAAGRAGELPVKPAPKAKTTVPVTVALVESDAGLLLQRRPAKGLLAGLWQPAAWEKALTKDELTAALAKLGVQATLTEPLPPAKHVFTHRVWQLSGWRGRAEACALPDGFVWAAPEQLAEVYPVPNAFGAYVKR